MNKRTLGALARVLCLCVISSPALANDSPAGTLIVLNKSEASASLLDVSTGEIRATIPTQKGPHEVAVSPDGGTAVVANYGARGEPGSTLTVIDLKAKKAVRTINLDKYQRPHGIAWRNDDRHVLATAESNRAVVEVDVVEGAVTRTFTTGQDVSHMLEIAANGERVFVANIGSGTATVIDLKSGKTLQSIPTGEGAEGITASADGSEVWVTNRAEDTITVLDATTLEIKATIPCASFPIRAKATPDGKHVLVSCARSGDLAVFDAKTKSEVRRISMDLEAITTENRLFGDRFGTSSVPVGVLIEPTNKLAWIAHTNADVVVELDLKTWSIVRLLEAGREPDGLAYSPLVLD
ncbi:MAG: beta-propeller fold lactonase family protein [bacterium]|nr:beta-propeller fold lactonase family protein [bacterium]